MAGSYLIFGDIEGKLDVLRVECTKCDRKGVYRVHKLTSRNAIVPKLNVPPRSLLPLRSIRIT